MANFGEMTEGKQWLGAIGGVALLSAALYFTMFRSMRDENTTSQKTLDTKVAENVQLEQYRPKLADMERQVANLKQQLEIERKIVPDDKEIEQFIKLVDAEGVKATIAGSGSSRGVPGRSSSSRRIDGNRASVGMSGSQKATMR